MKARLRYFWSRLDANYWFYPALFVVLGVGLAVLATWADRAHLADGWLSGLSPLETTPQSAQTMLSIIAGGMIGVAATVFSITIAAVAYASGTYGPRLMTNFLEDKGNQLSLATLIGTFVYAITVLSGVHGAGDNAANISGETLGGFVPQLALLGAYLLTALSVTVIVYLLNHIPSSIRINEVLRDIGERLLHEIARLYPECDSERAPDPAPRGEALRASDTGYVQLLDFEQLAECAKDRGVPVALRVRTGDFVHPGMVIAEAIGGAGDDVTALEDCLGTAFALGAERTAEQDPQFLLDELVEIGLRALSPGINDPFTAITAMHWLGAATAELGRRDLELEDGLCDGRRWVWPLADDFAHFLARGFGAMRSAAATSPIAAQVMLDCLEHAAEAVPHAGPRQLLREEGARLHAQARIALQGPDLTLVEARYAQFAGSF
ncbi:MAG: DUF2254 domain-containing protein [Sphingomonadales bacterium]|nr:DUF2254 domain-containing protein [Sphingomonadales bacterium]MBD3774954.1 DUF2254 domain-containing protein [Paracoccaceae bacterium]